MKKSLTIRTKLIILITAMAMLAFIFIGLALIQKWTEATRQSTINRATMFLNTATNAVVHECQKERGATGVFLGSKGTRFRSELRQQRILTDEKIQIMESFLEDFNPKSVSKDFDQQLGVALSDINQLRKKRSEIDKQSITGSEALAYYTDMNAEFLKLVDGVREITLTGESASIIGAYSSFLQSKERAGIERAILSITFSADAFPEKSYEKLITLIAEQNAYTSNFRRQTKNKHVQFYDRKMDHKATREVERMREIALRKGTTGGFGIEGKYWFNTITTKINLLKEVEDYLATDLLDFTAKMKAQKQSLVILFGFGVFALIALVTGGFFVIFSVTRSIMLTADVLGNISDGDGDLTMRLEVKNTDEIGQLSQHFNKFVEKLQSIIRAVTDNTLTLDATSEELSSNAEAMTSKAEGMNEQSNNAANAIEQLSSNLTSVAAGTEEMSITVSTVAAAIEEMSSSLIEVAKSCADGSIMSSDADIKTNAAGKTMEELNTSAGKIGKVIETINNIAGQTNLLALNATIEAASAGDAGKGFAVVAEEVKELAKQTANATEEIARLIGEMQDKTGIAVKSTSEISEIITQLNGTVQTIASAVEEQSATNNEIAKNVSAASEAATDISHNIQVASTDSVEISSNIQNLLSASDTVRLGSEKTSSNSEELSEMVANLRNQINQFKIN